jgi:hypothetical protein
MDTKMKEERHVNTSSPSCGVCINLSFDSVLPGKA